MPLIVSFIVEVIKQLGHGLAANTALRPVVRLQRAISDTRTRKADR